MYEEKTKSQGTKLKNNKKTDDCYFENFAVN